VKKLRDNRSKYFCDVRLTLLGIITTISCCLFLRGELLAQNCVLTGLNNTSITSSCNQACRDLTFQIPDLRSTSTYSVISIPYTPYPYLTASGTEDFNLYNDDKYSRVFDLPFPFCFFDSVYRKAVISSNGLVTFDTSYANCAGSGWFIDAPIPFGGFPDCSPGDYARTSIMAAFMDLDPRPGPASPIASSPPDRKIQWRVEGSAPCRRFVVSYYHIGAFQMTTCGQNPDSAATFQIVMYESTGLIDIFIQNKSCTATSANGTQAILGVQDFSRTKAVAAPGKNATTWTASNEGYRFVPSGGVSRFVSSELLSMNLSHIAWSNTSSATPGLLDITFPAICSSAPSTRYIIRTIFSACDNPSVQLTSMDTIGVNVTSSLNAEVTTTNTSCGAQNGTITIGTVSGGASPYTYSLDGSGYTSNVVYNNLGAGSHTINVKDANGCTFSINATINNVSGPTSVVATTTAAFCGGNNGTITIGAVTGGTSPYSFSLDGSGYSSTLVYNNIAAGSHTINVKDANGCINTVLIDIVEKPVLTVNATTLPASCNGRNDGVISIMAAGGSPGYQYSLDEVNFQSSNSFNVKAGNYTVEVKDQNGCTISKDITVGLQSNLTLSIGNDTTICEGGSAQLTSNSNATSFEWTPPNSLNNSSIARPVATPTTSTAYTVTATLGECNVTGTVRVTVKPAPIPMAGPDADICFGQNAQLSATGGTSYQWSPSRYLSSATIPNPTVIRPQENTQYALQVKDVNGCMSLTPDIVLVKVTPPISVLVSPRDSIVTEGDHVQLTATSIATNYNWTNSFTLSNPNIPNPIATIPAGSNGNTFTYTVTANTSAGCVGTASVTLKVYKGPDIYVPNAFTPNSDGKNDKFHPLTFGIKQINYFKVFNRWGQLIFSSTALNEGWDGTLGGIQQPIGVYVWMVQAVTRDEKVLTKKGTVTLIR
jgi:gliding motility-associated-like protein